MIGLNYILTYRADQCPEQYSSDIYRGKICRCPDTPIDVYVYGIHDAWANFVDTYLSGQDVTEKDEH